MSMSISIQAGANSSCMRAISQKITWRLTKETLTIQQLSEARRQNARRPTRKMNEFDSDGTCAPRALLLRSNAVHPRPHLNPLPLERRKAGVVRAQRGR